MPTESDHHPEEETQDTSPEMATISRLNVLKTFKDELDAARIAAGLSWQRLGVKALRAWLDNGGSAQPAPEPPQGHRILWFTEEVRKQLNFRLPAEAPAYLKESVAKIYQLVSRPRGVVYNLTGDNVQTPELEKIQGINPRARWLWDESPAGVVVRELDLMHLARVPGILTTFYQAVDPRNGRSYIEVGP